MPITSGGPVPARALAAASPIPHEHRNHSPATTSSAPPRDRSRQLRKELDDLTACTDPAQQQRRRHLVIIEYLPMARSIAASYLDHGVERADLEQLAFVGLVKAADRWTPDRCQDFRAFAVPATTGEIKHYLRDHAWLIRQPRKMQDTCQDTTDDAERPCLQQECRAADDEVLAATSGAGRQLRETRWTSRAFRLISIDDYGGAGRILTEELGEDDPGLRGVEDRLTVQRLLATLTVHERRVVQLRFEHDWSQTRIATELGISQMQVSRLLLTITGKLRAALQH